MFDFSDPDAARGWAPIDDRVMGGVSRSRWRHAPAGHAVFEGDVSLAQGGGFASVRSGAADRGRADAQACRVEARGDGRHYKLNLLTDDTFDGLLYQACLVFPAGAWATQDLPLSAFQPTFRGRRVPEAPALDPARIRQVGLMIAERQAGPFVLEVRGIRLI